MTFVVVANPVLDLLYLVIAFPIQVDMYNQIEYVKYANLDCSHDVHTEERSLGCHLENTLFQYNNSFLAEERAFK